MLAIFIHIPFITHNKHTTAEQVKIKNKCIYQCSQQFLFMYSRLEWQRKLHTNLALKHLQLKFVTLSKIIFITLKLMLAVKAHLYST